MAKRNANPFNASCPSQDILALIGSKWSMLLLCILGGEYMLVDKGGALAFFSPVAFLFAIVLTFFEGFIQFLQAYVFTLLSALYIAGSLEDQH